MEMNIKTIKQTIRDSKIWTFVHGIENTKKLLLLLHSYVTPENQEHQLPSQIEDIYALYAPSFQFCVPASPNSFVVSLLRHQVVGIRPWACTCVPSPPHWLVAQARPDSVRMFASVEERVALADFLDVTVTGQKFGKLARDSVDGSVSPGPSLPKNVIIIKIMITDHARVFMKRKIRNVWGFFFLNTEINLCIYSVWFFFTLALCRFSNFNFMAMNVIFITFKLNNWT